MLPLDDPTITVREFDGFKDFFAIYCKRQGVPSIVIQDFASGELSEFTVEGQVGEISPGLNSNYESKELHFFFQSPFVYEQTYVYSHEKRSKRMLGQRKLLGSPKILRNDFECEQLTVPAPDGAQIPMLLQYKKSGFQLNRKNRVLMEAYGAYNSPLSQSFNIV